MSSAALPIEQYPRFRVFALRPMKGRQDKWIPTCRQLFRTQVTVTVYKQNLTSVDLAPSWCRHFFNQIAAWRQSSRCKGSELTLGIETNVDSA